MEAFACGSASITSTLLFSERQPARLSTTMVLPEPPFIAPTVTTQAGFFGDVGALALAIPCLLND